MFIVIRTVISSRHAVHHSLHYGPFHSRLDAEEWSQRLAGGPNVVISIVSMHTVEWPITEENLATA